jgi:hypothetical protein
MFRTAVPETSIDEHRDALCNKNHVSPHLRVAHFNPSIFSESKTSGVNRSAKLDLRFGVNAPVRTHRSSRRRVGRNGRWREGHPL